MIIVGYTYEADVHCTDCALKAFRDLESRGAIDSEGNQVQPVFDITEGSELSHCADCGEPLMDHDCDEHGRWEVGYDGNDIADSARYQDHDDAKRWLIRELEEQADNVDSWADPPDHDCEELRHENDDSCPRQVANQLSFLAADLSLISQGESFESTVAGVRYWIKEVVA
jgi:hypothetical protein